MISFHIEEFNDFENHSIFDVRFEWFLFKSLLYITSFKFDESPHSIGPLIGAMLNYSHFEVGVLLAR